MDAPTVAVVRHHVMEDAWAVFDRQYTSEPALLLALDTALAVEGTARRVAAYVLDVASSVAAGQAAALSGTQVKRQRDGAEELEFFPGVSAPAADAARWAERAARLREQEAAPHRATANPAPDLTAWGVE